MLFPAIPVDSEDLVKLKKLLSGKGGYTCIKEVLVWTNDMEAGTVALPEGKLQELLNLVDIPTTQNRIGGKDLERLVGNLHSIHLTVPGAVVHLYHIQQYLAQGGGGPSLAVSGISL